MFSVYSKRVLKGAAEDVGVVEAGVIATLLTGLQPVVAFAIYMVAYKGSE
jgi:hypothetical protein